MRATGGAFRFSGEGAPGRFGPGWSRAPYECFWTISECSGKSGSRGGSVMTMRRDTIPFMKPAKPMESRPAVRSTQTATLAEIAREAGVSAPTVSKVLNGRADVAPGTRTRVEELLRAYGYRRRRAEAAR